MTHHYLENPKESARQSCRALVLYDLPFLWQVSWLAQIVDG